MSALSTTLKSHKLATLILLGAIGGLLFLRFQAAMAARADLAGDYVLAGDFYRNGPFQLSLHNTEKGLAGILRSKGRIYPVEATQSAPGEVSGQYWLGGQAVDFQLKGGQPWAPSSYALTTDQHRIELERAAALGGDLAGEWRSMYGELKIDKSDDGWLGLLTTEAGERIALAFEQRGLALPGVYRRAGQVHSFEGRLKLAGEDRIDLDIAGQTYRFVRAKVAKEHGLAFSEVLPAYDGIFTVNDFVLTNAVRRYRQGGLNRWQCEGSFKTPSGEQAIIGCGIEAPDRLWINYRSGGPNNPDFGVAILKRRADGVFELSGYGPTKVLHRATPRLAPGHYRGTQTHVQLWQDAEGRVQGRLSWFGRPYRLRGNLEAGVVHAVARGEDGQELRMLLAETPKGPSISEIGGRTIGLTYLGLRLAGGDQ